MRAVCWEGKRTCRVEDVLDPKLLNRRPHRQGLVHRDLRLGPAPVQRLHPHDGAGRHPGHEFMGEVVEVGPRSTTSRSATASWSPSHRLRHLLAVPAAAVLALRELEPERLDGREADGPRDVRHLRLLAHDGRLRRRPGRVRPGAVRRRRAAQDPGRHPGRAGAVPLGHPADRLHGRRVLRHQARRHDRRLGLRPVGQLAIASAYLLGAERVIAIDRFPYRLGWPARRPVRRRSTTRRSTSTTR